MNKNTLIAVVIVALVVVGGLVFYGSNKTNQLSNNVSSTSPITNGNVTQKTTTTTTTVSNAGLPVVTTNASVAPSGTTAVVKGQVTPNGVFTNYWYEYGINANLGKKTPNQLVGSGFVSIPAPGYITNLVKSTTYYFRLVAENQYGKVLGTQYTFQTTQGTAAPVGTAPRVTTLTVSGLSRTTANLNGEVTPNKTNTQYWFEYGKTAELGNISAFSSAGEGSVKVPVSISLADLLPNTTYYFRLNAQNEFGTINGSILNFKTKSPEKIINNKIINVN